jgi:uncharacterized membrane protein YuzA (DUF378 family)
MTDPSSLPPPDLLDSAGRLKRLITSLAIGAAGAIVAYLICDRLAEPDTQAAVGGSMNRAYRFVFYVTGLAGAVCFLVALGIQSKLAKQRWRAGLVPRARIERE